MSLLDDRRDTITLIPEVESTDSLDNKTRVPDPDTSNHITLYGRFQEGQSTELTADGQVVATFATFITRRFPAGTYARIVRNGRDYDVTGEVIRSNGSATTRHDTVSLKARRAESVIVNG